VQLLCGAASLATKEVIYKHAISTITPTAPIKLYQEEQPEAENASEPAPRRPLVETRRR
jgi:Hfq protein